MRLPIIGLMTILTIWMVSISCERIKPEPPRQTLLDSTLSIPLSTLTIPIRYEVSKLEDMVNSKITDIILNEKFKVNDKGDSLSIVVEKSSVISLSWSNPTLYYSVPVRVSGKYFKRVGNTMISNNQPIQMELVLHMVTTLGIGSNWQLKTKTILDEIKWIKEPKLKIIVVRINLRKKVEEAINKNKDKLTAKLDESIPDILNTRKVISKLWLDIQKPIRINKMEKDVWIKAYGKMITARFIDSESSLIALNVQLKAQLESFIEGDEMPASNDTLPPYVINRFDHDSITLFVLMKLPFKQAEELLNKTLTGKELSAEGYSTTIRKLNLYGTDSAVCLQVNVRGDVDGRVFVTAVPGYDTASATLYAREFNYDLDTENALVNSANWLLQDTVLNIVRKKLVINVQPFIDSLPSLIMRGVEKGKTGKKIDVTISSLKIKPINHLITKTELQVLFFASGRARIDLEQKLFNRKKKRSRKKS